MVTTFVRCFRPVGSLYLAKILQSFSPPLLDLDLDLERQLSSASYDTSEFLFRRLHEYKRTREVKGVFLSANPKTDF